LLTPVQVSKEEWTRQPVGKAICPVEFGPTLFIHMSTVAARQLKEQQMSRIPGITLFCLFGALFAAPVQGGPIPASPSPVPSAGESLLTSFIVGAASSLNVDWEVIPTAGTAFPGGLYAYLYQIENTSLANVDAYSVTVPVNVIGTVVGAGILAGDNLDANTLFHPGHNFGNFPILATEQDPFPFQLLTGGSASIDVPDHNVTWTFNPLVAGNESETLYFLSTMPPTYGNAVAQDSIPPSPWASLAPGGAQPIPVPVPEPAALVLLGFGIMGLAAGRRFMS
jgi:hypothetical protein